MCLLLPPSSFSPHTRTCMQATSNSKPTTPHSLNSSFFFLLAVRSVLIPIPSNAHKGSHITPFNCSIPIHEWTTPSIISYSMSKIFLVSLLNIVLELSQSFQWNYYHALETSRGLSSSPFAAPRSRELHLFPPRDDFSFDPANNDDYGITSHHQSSSSPSSSSSSSSRTTKSISSNQQHYDPTKQKNLVWIIDDEQPILDAVGEYLSSSGCYQVQPFLNATLPLYLLQKEEGHPDAIISDVMMPAISGIDFLTIIRNNVSPSIHNIPFILLTAKGLTEDRIRGYDAGADGYLMKPFDPEELVVMLDQMIQRKRLLQADGDSISVQELRNDLSEVKGLLEEKTLLEESTKNEIGGLGRGSHSILSDIEVSILELLCEGYMNKEIASELQYSTSMVEKYLTSMFRKTGCANRTELVRWAVANEYVDI